MSKTCGSCKNNDGFSYPNDMVKCRADGTFKRFENICDKDCKDSKAENEILSYISSVNQPQHDMDFYKFLSMLLLLGYNFKSNESLDYYRGKCDAYEKLLSELIRDD